MPENKSDYLASTKCIARMILMIRGQRVMLTSNKELAEKLSDLEKRYDKQFAVVFEAIRELMQTPKPKTAKIGFGSRNDE